MAPNVGQTLRNIAVTSLDPSTVATTPAPAHQDAPKLRDVGVHAHGTSYTTAKPASPYSLSKWNPAGARSGNTVHSLLDGGASGTAGPAQPKAEAQAGQRLRSGSLEVQDFERIGADKAGELVSKMASGNPRQRQNLERLMDDPAFAKHLGAALNTMDAASGMKLLDSLYKTKEPSAQVAATLHAGLDAMDPARRGSLMNEALGAGAPGRAPDPEAKKAVEGYLGQKIQSGQLRSEHFQGVDPKVAAGAIQQLAGGDQTQRANLKRLMLEPSFSKTLGPALEDMKPDGRQQVLRFVGENAVHATRTLELALDTMSSPRRAEMLRDAYIQGDQSAVDAANRYVGGRSERATEVYNSLAAGSPADLGKGLQRMSDSALRSLMSGLGKLPAGEAQMQFRKLGDAVFGPPEPNPKLGEQLITAMKDNPVLSAKLLSHAAADEYGGRSRGAEINNGRRLAAQVLDSMNPQQIQSFFEQIGNGPDAQKVREFMDHNTHVEKAGDRTSPSADASIDKVRHGYRMWRTTGPDGVKEAGKKAMLEGLRADPNAVIRKLDSGELKDIVKAFLKDGDMNRLTEVAKALSPQQAAKLARVIPIAAKESKAEIAAGSWLGDVLSGAELSLETGKEKGPKFGAKWGPGALVKGSRDREANAAESALSRFVLGWEDHLSKMSANDKQAFLDEMGGIRISGGG